MEIIYKWLLYNGGTCNVCWTSYFHFMQFF